MDRAVAALAICAEKLRRRNVTLARSVATEACRRAHNGGDFVERVREQSVDLGVRQLSWAPTSLAAGAIARAGMSNGGLTLISRTRQD